jgi:hypothetical protein
MRSGLPKVKALSYINSSDLFLMDLGLMARQPLDKSSNIAVQPSFRLEVQDRLLIFAPWWLPAVAGLMPFLPSHCRILE